KTAYEIFTRLEFRRVLFRSEAVSQVPDRPEWTKKDKLAFEREMLGLYVSDHPLRGLESVLAKEASVSVEQATNTEASPNLDGEKTGRASCRRREQNYQATVA